jgi:PhnB protein
MATSIQPYLTLHGRCEEALAFYQEALGARIDMIMRFDESPDPVPEGMLPPGFEKKIMHASFRVGESVLMATDGCENSGALSGFSLSLALTEESDADRFFTALSHGGEVTMPLGRTFWSPKFGMVTDRFGVSWMINVLPAPERA